MTDSFLSADDVSLMTTSEIVDLLCSETSEDATFCFISAISVFGIESKSDAVDALEKDKLAMAWAKYTAMQIPKPHHKP